MQRLVRRAWFGAAWLSVLVALTMAPEAGAAVQRVKYQSGNNYLIVEVLNDDLVHFELSALGPGPDIRAAETASFALGDFRITLAAPMTFSSPLHEYIKQRSEVPFEITLRTNRADQTGLLNVKRAHGARIELTG